MGWEVDSEHPYKYGPGGFCPIELGDRVANRFIVLHKLGYGGFATVWLVPDEKQRHGRYVALKVVSADCSKDAKFESTKVVDPLRGYERDNRFPGLFVLELERFFHTSRNGRHLCQVFPALGPALASLNTSDFRLYPSFAGTFAQQLAHALDTMHALGVCHGADVWALGCILYELRYPMTLFQDSSPLATASRMCEILGNLPREWMEFPFDDGYPVHEALQRGIEYTTLADFTERNGFTLDTEVGLIREPQRPESTRLGTLKPIGKDDAALFTDLLCKIFDYNHQKRITARQVLAHPWLKETGGSVEPVTKEESWCLVTRLSAKV
ncbi:hypothetical protein VTI74DRAFT_11495 [Chaetomium olivicolor]